MYSKEMHKAHEKSLQAYERMIAFAQDKNNSLERVRGKALRFYREDCRYCTAVNDRCQSCLLGSGDRSGFSLACTEGIMQSSHRECDDAGLLSEYLNKEEIAERFQVRLDHLVIKAEMNLAGEPCPMEEECGKGKSGYYGMVQIC